jgi:hypothetical protein
MVRKHVARRRLSRDGVLHSSVSQEQITLLWRTLDEAVT